MLASKISDLTSSYIFWYSGHPKTPKNVFFRISHNYWPFWCRRPNMGSTMRKLTSRRFQKCGTYWVFEFLNGSYGCSKSTESEIFDLSPKIGDVTKKRHGFNKPFWDLIWIEYQTYHVRTLFYSYEVLERNIEAVSFFCDVATRGIFFLRFDPTLTANNSGLKPWNIEKYHIFGKPWACSSTWWNPGWVILLENFE